MNYTFYYREQRHNPGKADVGRFDIAAKDDAFQLATLEEDADFKLTIHEVKSASTAPRSGIVVMQFSSDKHGISVVEFSDDDLTYEEQLLRMMRTATDVIAKRAFKIKED